MKSTLAIVLTAVLGFAVATVVFAQENEQMDATANTEVVANTADDAGAETANEVTNQEEAPAADSSAPAAY